MSRNVTAIRKPAARPAPFELTLAHIKSTANYEHFASESKGVHIVQLYLAKDRFPQGAPTSLTVQLIA